MLSSFLKPTTPIPRYICRRPANTHLFIYKADEGHFLIMTMSYTFVALTILGRKRQTQKFVDAPGTLHRTAFSVFRADREMQEYRKTNQGPGKVKCLVRLHEMVR
jgi:hypothetical protein